MKKQIDVELERIRNYEEIIEKALFEYAYKNPKDLNYNQLKCIEKFISTLIWGEIDYIVRHSNDYLESIKE
jgi:hypothetical protein